MRIILGLAIYFITQCALADSIFLVPGKSWGLKFNSPKLVEQSGKTSETEYQFEASTNAGFNLSAFVEPASGKGTNAAECMKYYWALSAKNPDIQKDTIKIVGTDPFAVVTYVVETTYKGKPYTLVNANYYGFRDGNCIDFHVSQVASPDTKIDYKNLIEFGASFSYYK